MLSILRALLTCLTLAIAASASGMRAPAVEQVMAAHAAPASPAIETCSAFKTDIPVSDQVLTFNEWKSKSVQDAKAASSAAHLSTDTRLSYEKVVDIYTSYKQQTLVHLTLDNGQQLTATEGHPFKTTDGWRDAVLLKKGGQLLLKGGEGDADALAVNLQLNTPLTQVNSAQADTNSVALGNQATNAAQPGGRAITIADIRLEVKTVAVYNLEVANAHTFFVGVDGVLVHNGFGAYDILFPDGARYIGKGALDRMMASAKRLGGGRGTPVCTFHAAGSDKASFILEDILIEKYGLEALLNKINSPGKRIRGR
jgi:hypothetical protein